MGYRPICDTWLLARSKVKYYGAYPAGFLGRARAVLGVGPQDSVLHLCSGRVVDYPFDGFGPKDLTVDADPDQNPDIVWDITQPGLDGLIDRDISAVLADPPYTEEDAKHYAPLGMFPTARQCLTTGLDLVDVGEKVGVLHYVAPRPPKGTKFVACISVVVGFENRVRLFSVYEKR